MLDDYIDTAPEGSNEAVEKPRYHGSSQGVSYYNRASRQACAGGYCIKDLFAKEIKKDDPECECVFCVGTYSRVCVCIAAA